MSLRHEFVLLALQPEANIAELARRYHISRKTAYKWINRYREGGTEALVDRSRRPLHSPARTAHEVETAVLRLRDAHPKWGGRKIRAVLLKTGIEAPSPTTITAILRRHGRLSAEPVPRRPMTRFEAEAPNELWQMDHKGDFLLGNGVRCFPLTDLDDHSRLLLGLDGQIDQSRAGVQACLTRLFKHYGLPRRLLCDNGPPWGSGWRRTDLDGRRWPRYTRLAAWLMRLGIGVVHGRPFHPQTQGKDERLHRTLSEEVLQALDGGAGFADLSTCQRAFDRWRAMYNEQRPHEALALEVPASRYCISERRFPSQMPKVEYDAALEVRSVDSEGRISFQGYRFRVGKAFSGERVGVRATERSGIWQIYYAHQPVWLVDLNTFNVPD